MSSKPTQTTKTDIARHKRLATEAIGFPPAGDTAAAAPDFSPHVQRFKTFHLHVCKSTVELKLAKYFAGLEVNALYDLHAQIHGETRGRPSSKEIVETTSTISLNDFLEEHLGVTSRTARTYRNFFLATASNAPEIADKLNEVWSGQLALPSSDSTSLQTLCTSHAEMLHTLAKSPDEFGLHELFEIPQRDVSPKDPDEDNDSQRKKAERAALVKFWSESLVRRLENQELHRLPAPVLEAVVVKMEEAAKAARETLATKKNKRR